MFKILATLLTVAVVANAVAVIEPRTDCTKVAEGYLSANVSGHLKSFTINKHNQVNYVGDGKNPLYVEVQGCTSLKSVDPYGGGVLGRVYVPSAKKCIAISNSPYGPQPYWSHLEACDTSPYFRWKWFQPVNNLYFFRFNYEGGGGEEYNGYKGDGTGKPLITEASSIDYKQIFIYGAFDDNPPFHLSKTCA